ncbi:CMRF35-like molecule 1 [Gambusia affinis]|uniref:CMRF35-like molecule 1 n=1 Tax=Gambusia affinis TaxID=33528 RepID=UPI001CDC2364|nr:CMRF35-like molecule 1 [Gambusia affinis]
MQQVFIFCFLSALCGAKTLIQTEGGSITAKCSFTFSGRRKFVCRDPCENRDVLIETEATEAEKGRYSIRYREGTFPASSTVLYVNISQLVQSDSGRYWCGLKRRFMTDSRQEFHVNVTNDMKELEQQQTEATGVSKGYVLPLALCVAILFAAAVLLLYKWKTRRESDGSTSRRQSSINTNNNRRRRSTQFSASKFTNRTPPPDAQQQLYYNL